MMDPDFLPIFIILIAGAFIFMPQISPQQEQQESDNFETLEGWEVNANVEGNTTWSFTLDDSWSSQDVNSALLTINPRDCRHNPCRVAVYKDFDMSNADYVNITYHTKEIHGYNAQHHKIWVAGDTVYFNRNKGNTPKNGKLKINVSGKDGMGRIKVINKVRGDYSQFFHPNRWQSKINFDEIRFGTYD